MKSIHRISSVPIIVMQVCSTWLFARIADTTRLVVISTENAPKIKPDTSYLFVANHASYLDVYSLFAGLPIVDIAKASPTRFMTAPKIFYSLLRPIIMLGGGFPAKKINDDSYSAVDASIKYLGLGQNVVIFPAAGRIPREHIKPRPGVVRIIQQCPHPLTVMLVHLKWKKIGRFKRELVVAYGECNDTSTPEIIMDQIYSL